MKWVLIVIAIMSNGTAEAYRDNGAFASKDKCVDRAQSVHDLLVQRQYEDILSAQFTCVPEKEADDEAFWNPQIPVDQRPKIGQGLPDRMKPGT